MTENIMSEEQYNELLKAYTKEALAIPINNMLFLKNVGCANC